MNKVAKFTFAVSTMLLLAGCHQKPKQQTHSNNSDGLQISRVHHTGHLSDKNLTPQMTVAVVTTYAAKKYPDEWANALQKARMHGLQVNLKNQADYSYMTNGSGVAYMVDKDVGYTLTQQDNSQPQFYIYANQKELTSISMKQMVDYLNHHNGEAVVKSLVKEAKVADQRSEGSDNNQNNSKVPGDLGYYHIPTSMQGTWYGYSEDSNKISVMTISDHEISDSVSKYKTELHKPDFKVIGKYMDGNKIPSSYQKVTKNWGRVKWEHAHGGHEVDPINWMNVRGWLQDAGDGEYYGLTQEHGQTVLVSAHGAGIWADSVYWKNPDLAKKFKNEKFKNLHYQDMP